VTKVTVNSGDIARYFLWKYGDEPEDAISHLKLQKLLYYAQGYHLAKYDEPLFYETIEAWPHGPVVPSIYRAYSQYEGGRIPKPEGFNPEILPPKVRHLLDKVYQAFGQYTAWKLREMTHEEAPWLIARAEDTFISHDLIRDFFKSRISPNPQAPYTAIEQRLHSYVDQGVGAFGRRREAIRANVVRLIGASKCPARYTDFATKLILSKQMPGRIDEAIELLASSGRDKVQSLFSEAALLMPPNEDNGDYWYALIRSMGFLGLSSDLTKFVTSPYVRIREATAEALSDLGDEYSLSLLKALSETDQSTFIQRIATELLQDRSTD
jgi:uncharacterized phage-associated protein